MEKLRKTIEQYGRWKDLGIYIDRMEGHLETDFSHSLENAKALLESIGKEICSVKEVELGSSPTINGVIKAAFTALGYPNEDMVRTISGSLANIGQQIGTLRNGISPTSHGRSMDELRDRNSSIDLLTRDFLIDSTVVVAVFLIRSFEERKDMAVPRESEVAVGEKIIYADAEDFNESWDQSFGDFQMGVYSFVASEVLYGLDYQAYETEYKLFMESGDELEGDAEE